jgi:hypothetical protein
MQHQHYLMRGRSHHYHLTYLLSADNLTGIYKTLTDTMGKWSGGIGIHVTKVRAKGTLIKQTNGKNLMVLSLC